MTHALWSSFGISICVLVVWHPHLSIYEDSSLLRCDTLPFGKLFMMFQMILQCVGKNLPDSTVSLLRLFKSSAIPLSKPQISLFIFPCFTKPLVITFVLVFMYDIAPIHSQCTSNQRQICCVHSSNSLAVEVGWESLRLYRDIMLFDISYHYFTWTISCDGTQHSAVQVFRYSVSMHFRPTYCSQCCVFTHHIYGRCWKCFPSAHRRVSHLTFLLHARVWIK